MIVQNNIGMNLYNNIAGTQHSYNNSMQQISSGSRINRAADDAAGLAISEQMNGQIRGMAQANKNAYDGVSMFQTADGALSSIHENLGRMRELAVQASNGILSDGDRAALNEEFSSLKEELARIAERTQFNGEKLLDGSLDSDLLIGANSDEVVNIKGGDMSLAGLGIESLSIDSLSGSQDAIKLISDAVDKVSSQRSEFGAYQNRFETSINNTNNAMENLTASDSKISDIDIALAAMKMSKDNIMQQSGIAMLAQANQSNAMVLNLLR